jgi:tetratricopeptide (TPR) repeat protein
MTIRQARKSMAESFNHLLFYKSVREVKFNRQRVTFVADEEGSRAERPRGVSQRDEPLATGGKICSITFAELKNLSVDYLTKKRTLVESNGKWLHFFTTESQARMFVDTALILKAAAAASDSDATDFAAFSTAAQLWRDTVPKPNMPDEARAYKALAEDAFKRKDYGAAFDAYCEALDKHPMWPEGHYNAALLAAEAEDYELAAQHMHRYLVLAPDAKDATASKDKFLLWQLKAKE